VESELGLPGRLPKSTQHLEEQSILPKLEGGGLDGGKFNPEPTQPELDPAPSRLSRAAQQIPKQRRQIMSEYIIAHPYLFFFGVVIIVFAIEGIFTQFAKRRHR
jgi:hypothetical protein